MLGKCCISFWKRDGIIHCQAAMSVAQQHTMFCMYVHHGLLSISLPFLSHFCHCRQRLVAAAKKCKSCNYRNQDSCLDEAVSRKYVDITGKGILILTGTKRKEVTASSYCTNNCTSCTQLSDVYSKWCCLLNWGHGGFGGQDQSQLASQASQGTGLQHHFSASSVLQGSPILSFQGFLEKLSQVSQDISHPTGRYEGRDQIKTTPLQDKTGILQVHLHI